MGTHHPFTLLVLVSLPPLEQAIAAQHTAAAEVNEEEIAAMRAAIEANNARVQRLRKQRQDLEVSLRSHVSGSAMFSVSVERLRMFL